MPAPDQSREFDARAILRQLGQPLSAILSNTQVAKRFLASEAPDVAEVRAVVSDIVTQSKKAAALFRRLEDYLLTRVNSTRE